MSLFDKDILEKEIPEVKWLSLLRKIIGHTVSSMIQEFNYYERNVEINIRHELMMHAVDMLYRVIGCSVSKIGYLGHCPVFSINITYIDADSECQFRKIYAGKDGIINNPYYDSDFTLLNRFSYEFI